MLIINKSDMAEINETNEMVATICNQLQTVQNQILNNYYTQYLRQQCATKKITTIHTEVTVTIHISIPYENDTDYTWIGNDKTLHFLFQTFSLLCGKTNTIHDYATIFIMQIKRRLIYNINQQYARISKMINKHNFFCSGKSKII